MVRTYLVGLLLLGLPALAAAQYTFRDVLLPFTGARQLAVSGVAHGDLSGLYLDARGNEVGFLDLCAADVVIPWPLLVPTTQSATALAGRYLAPTGRTTGWLLHDGTLTTIEGPRDAQRRFPARTELFDVNDAPVAVGTYQDADGVEHGLRYTLNPEAIDTIDAPGATHTSLLRISNQGWILVQGLDAANTKSYWIWDNGVFTPLPVPTLPGLSLVGRLPDGSLVGNAGPDGVIIQGDTVTLVRVPGSTTTQLVGHTQEGILYGRVVDAQGERGLLAIPEGLPDPCPAPPAKHEGKQKRAR